MRTLTEELTTEPRLLRLYQILGSSRRGIPPLIPVGKSTWWRWIASGKAPAPIKLSTRVTVWRASDIADFLANTNNTLQP